MFYFNSKTREQSVTFHNVRLNQDWCRKYLGINKFQTAIISIIFKLLQDDPEKPAMRISGEVVIDEVRVLTGQICETLMETELQYNQKFLRFANIWRKYHMNDKTFGTEEQLDKLLYAVMEQRLDPGDLRNIPVCFDYLYKHGWAISETPDGEMFTYGGGILYLPIPKEILQELYLWSSAD